MQLGPQDKGPCHPTVKTAFSEFASSREVFVAGLTCFTAGLSIPVHVINTFTDILQNVCMEPFQTISNVCYLSKLGMLQVEVWNHTTSTGFSFLGWRNDIRRIQ